MLEGTLISVLVAVIVFAAIFYFIDRTPLEPGLRQIVKLVVGAIAIIWLLSLVL